MRLNQWPGRSAETVAEVADTSSRVSVSALPSARQASWSAISRRTRPNRSGVPSAERTNVRSDRWKPPSGAGHRPVDDLTSLPPRPELPAAGNRRCGRPLGLEVMILRRTVGKTARPAP